MLSVENVAKVYETRRGLAGARARVEALKGVSFRIEKGQSFGLVGESGSGKTTLTRCILRLEEPTTGKVIFDGTDLSTLTPRQMRRMRSRMQIVFQDPYASLNPRFTVRDIVAEPIDIHRLMHGSTRGARTDRVVELLGLVGLGEQHLYRYPHEFSGGQRQRICIARALAAGPELLILDEPTSALDVSVQAQVLNLLQDLQARLGLTYLFISHDLGVIRCVCDRVALIYRGAIVEEGGVDDIFERPQDTYTRELIAAMPEPDPALSPFRTAADAA